MGTPKTGSSGLPTQIQGRLQAGRLNLLMPAFGALTGGLDVGDAALAPLRGKDTQLYLLGRDAVFAAPAGLAGR